MGTYTDIPEYMTAEEIRHATLENDLIGVLTTYGINSWISTRDGLIKEMKTLVIQR